MLSDYSYRCFWTCGIGTCEASGVLAETGEVESSSATLPVGTYVYIIILSTLHLLPSRGGSSYSKTILLYGVPPPSRQRCPGVVTYDDVHAVKLIYRTLRIGKVFVVQLFDVYVLRYNLFFILLLFLKLIGYDST